LDVYSQEDLDLYKAISAEQVETRVDPPPLRPR